MHLQNLLSKINIRYRTNRHNSLNRVHLPGTKDERKPIVCWQSYNTPGQIDYLDGRRASRFNFLFYGVEGFSADELVSQAYTISAGRFIRKFNDDLPDSQVSAIAEEYMSQFVFEVKILENTEDAYTSSKHARDLGSCMTDRPYTKFYQENGIKAVAALNDNGQILARALLWDDCEVKDTKEVVTLVDYIYGPPSERDAITRWAHKNGYYVGGYQEFIGPDGKNRTLLVRKRLPNPLIGTYPYFDTMKHLDLENGWIYNYSTEDTDYGGSTCGRLENWFCSNCGDFIGKRTKLRVSCMCEKCLKKHCQLIDGNWYYDRETFVCLVCKERKAKGVNFNQSKVGPVCNDCYKTIKEEEALCK